MRYFTYREFTRKSHCAEIFQKSGMKQKSYTINVFIVIFLKILFICFRGYLSLKKIKCTLTAFHLERLCPQHVTTRNQPLKSTYNKKQDLYIYPKTNYSVPVCSSLNFIVIVIWFLKHYLFYPQGVQIFSLSWKRCES